jgi:hypothetical protein
VGRS